MKRGVMDKNHLEDTGPVDECEICYKPGHKAKRHMMRYWLWRWRYKG